VNSDWQQSERELGISTKQAYGYIQSRLNTPDQLRSVHFIKNLLGRLRPYALHIGFAAVGVSIVAIGSASTNQSSQYNTTQLLAQSAGYREAVDETASAYVAANLAGTLGLRMSDQMTAGVERLNAQYQYLADGDAYVSSSSAVATDTITLADITSHTVASGESVDDIANQYNISPDTVRWANGMFASDRVSEGETLVILPIDGVLHTVGANDTPEKLAEKYDARVAQIISFNDAEVAGLSEGRDIIIPNGTKPAPEVAPTPSPSADPVQSSFASSGFTPRIGGGNGYAFGYCTWHVANVIDVPNNWGNANTWAHFARLSGWNVSSTPTPGAIAQRGGGLGHVGVVLEVRGNEVLIEDMNGRAGWGQVGVGWEPSNRYSAYITR